MHEFTKDNFDRFWLPVDEDGRLPKASLLHLIMVLAAATWHGMASAQHCRKLQATAATPTPVLYRALQDAPLGEYSYNPQQWCQWFRVLRTIEHGLRHGVVALAENVEAWRLAPVMEERLSTAAVRTGLSCRLLSWVVCCWREQAIWPPHPAHQHRPCLGMLLQAATHRPTRSVLRRS